jgi:hypothetical protein
MVLLTDESGCVVDVSSIGPLVSSSFFLRLQPTADDEAFDRQM